MSSEASSSKRKIFPLFGYPIAQSSAPAFHNVVFASDGQDAEYRLYPTSEISIGMLELLRSEECGGAAVTMPLKTRIIPHLDSITPESKATGAVNSIVKLRQGGKVEMIGTNTDYIGIMEVLNDSISAQAPTFRTALQDGSFAGAVIGGGATTRSAIYTLYNLGMRIVYIINREASETEATIAWFQDGGFTPGLKLVGLRDAIHAELELGHEETLPIGLVVGAIPASPPSTPAERTVYSTAMQLFTLASSRSRSPSSQDGSDYTPVLLEMAYIPQRTPLLVTAEALGLRVVGGINVMIQQGLAQQRIWKSGDLTAPDVISKHAELAGRGIILGDG